MVIIKVNYELLEKYVTKKKLLYFIYHLQIITISKFSPSSVRVKEDVLGTIISVYII